MSARDGNDEGGGGDKIVLAGVSKRFGKKVVLDGLDLNLKRGESVVVIGGSGTGKSVMLKCILGLLTPEAGSIRIDGEEMVGAPRARRERMLREIGMLFQNAALFDSLSVAENVAFSLTAGRGLSREEALPIALEKLAKVGLDEAMAWRSPADLSQGMKKRVGLARAIAAEPDIIFFDEPTTGLDPIMGDVINDLIVECVRDLGATTLTITHDMASARVIADRVAMLYQGRIAWLGPTAELERSDSAVLDQFVHGRTEGPISLDLR